MKTTFSRPVATAEFSKFAGILTAALSQDRNGMDLTEEGDIMKRWQEYTEELYIKVLMIWITMMVWSVTLSQTSWSCEVKRTLRSITKK